MTKKPIAIIGGSGFAHLLKGDKDKIETPYGDSHFLRTQIGGREVVAIKRHGIDGHKIPPHKINFRANIKATEMLGVEGIVTTHATGIVNKDGFAPGKIVLPNAFVPHQIGINGGPVTFFDEDVHHADMGSPRDEIIYQKLLAAAEALGIDVVKLATMITTPGPRYETAGEVKLFASWGMDLVGMTHAYEAILAMELKMRIASVAICTNYGTGIVPNAKLEHREVEEAMAIAGPQVLKMIEKALELM
ncbi:MAG: MTAP family purine nucleoside phosphorylase [Candidatus Bilamarchaeum sp.]|jgi:5'-methylthioadenosine phosphorylase